MAFHPIPLHPWTRNANRAKAFKLEKIVLNYALRSVNGPYQFHELRRARLVPIVFENDFNEVIAGIFDLHSPRTGKLFERHVSERGRSQTGVFRRACPLRKTRCTFAAQAPGPLRLLNQAA